MPTSVFFRSWIQIFWRASLTFSYGSSPTGFQMYTTKCIPTTTTWKIFIFSKWKMTFEIKISFCQTGPLGYKLLRRKNFGHMASVFKRKTHHICPKRVEQCFEIWISQTSFCSGRKWRWHLNSKLVVSEGSITLPISYYCLINGCKLSSVIPLQN